MANTAQSGSIYVESTGVVFTGKTKVAYIIFTPNANNDMITIIDGDSGSDPVKIHIHGAIAQETKMFDISNRPMIFQNGIYISALSSNAKATLILTSGEN
jgi:hypothetical protein